MGNKIYQEIFKRNFSCSFTFEIERLTQVVLLKHSK